MGQEYMCGYLLYASGYLFTFQSHKYPIINVTCTIFKVVLYVVSINTNQK